MINGIIFDMDGTMVDNMMTHHRAWKKILAEYGLDLTLEEVKASIHGKNEEILERLFGDRFTPEDRRRVSWEKEARYREVFLPELKLIDGLTEFLQDIHSTGISMGIGTAAPPENVDFVLNHLSLRHYFKGVIDASQVSKGKPDPEVFEKTAALMAIPIQQCVIFEDSPTGAETAYRAGCPVYIVTTTHHPAEFERFPNVKGFLKDFSEVKLEMVLGSQF